MLRVCAFSSRRYRICCFVLQVDQLSIFKSIAKWSVSVQRERHRTGHAKGVPGLGFRYALFIFFALFFCSLLFTRHHLKCSMYLTCICLSVCLSARCITTVQVYLVPCLLSCPSMCCTQWSAVHSGRRQAAAKGTLCGVCLCVRVVCLVFLVLCELK